MEKLKLTSLVLILVVSNVFAATITKKQLKSMTCVEAQELVKNYKYVEVQLGGFLGTTFFEPVYYDLSKKECESRWHGSDGRNYLLPVTVKTSDIRNCLIGVTCQEQGN